MNDVHLRPRRSTPRVANRVAQQIALELLDGEFEPGHRLPPEKELMAELGASRQALRGALRLLEAWGLVTMKMGREGGPVIRRPEPADMVDQLGVLIQHERATVADVWLARRAIEPMIAEAAARHATEEQISEMEALLDHMEAADDQSYDEYLADAVRFSTLIGEASQQVLLAYFLDAITLVTDAYVMPRLPFDAHRRTRLLKASRELADAIKSRDPDDARDVSLRGRLESERYWRKRMPEIVDSPIVNFASSSIDPMSVVADPDRLARDGSGRRKVSKTSRRPAKPRATVR